MIADDARSTIGEQRVRGGADAYWRCVEFLVEEAAALDENRVQDWLAMLHPDIDYRVPIRLTRERTGGPGFSSESFHFLETHSTLALRVERLTGDYAWAEDPPSRARRFVSNFRVFTLAGCDDLRVKSNLLIYRERLDERNYQLISAERQDDLRSDQQSLRLVRRVVLLDHTTLLTPNMSLFL